MARRLATIARDINDNCDGFTATLEKGHCNTDRKIGRLRWPGKGRTGTRIIVRNAQGKRVLDHNSAETYRTNQEVEDWLEKLKRYIEENDSKLRVFCPHCRVKLQTWPSNPPFGHCPKCSSSFLTVDAHLA